MFLLLRHAVFPVFIALIKALVQLYCSEHSSAVRDNRIGYEISPGNEEVDEVQQPGSVMVPLEGGLLQEQLWDVLETLQL
jgi:hypothetical protein